MPKDPVKDRGALREDEPETTDDLETAEAKSGSIDERVPEGFPTDAVGIDAPVPASAIPQAGIAVPHPGEEPGEGERVLDLERKAQRSKPGQ